MISLSRIYILLGFVATQAIALPISEETARTIAVNWYTHYAPAGLSTSDIAICQLHTFSSGSLADYFICAFEPEGFVVVSGDNAAIPVIGYSHDSPFQVELTHPALQGFFSTVREQLQWIRSENSGNTVTLPLWQEILDNMIPVHNRDRDVAPLLSTTWHQNCGYNDDCPIDGDGPCGHVYAGCVATAMAQVMKFWEHPERGSGAHGYMHPDYGYLFVNYYDATYDWVNMPDNQSNADIAELLYHCGVALEMEYGPDGSGAPAGDYDYPSVVTALPDYFDYKTDIDFFWRDEFTPYGWRTLLEGQLDNGRPVIYRGTGEVGHAFVCDGYQGVEYYHFNWGWSGYFDGYYYLYDLAPGDHDFYFDHGAVVNIRPDVPLTPGEIEDLKLTLMGDDVRLEWTAINDAEGYNIYRSVIPYGQSGVLLETITGNMITLADELHFYSGAFYYVTVVYDGE